MKFNVISLRQIIFLAGGFTLILLGAGILALDIYFMVTAKTGKGVGYLSLYEFLSLVRTRDSMNSLQMFIQNHLGITAWRDVARPLLTYTPVSLILGLPGMAMSYSGIRAIRQGNCADPDDQDEMAYSTHAFLAKAMDQNNQPSHKS